MLIIDNNDNINNNNYYIDADDDDDDDDDDDNDDDDDDNDDDDDDDDGGDDSDVANRSDPKRFVRLRQSLSYFIMYYTLLHLYKQIVCAERDHTRHPVAPQSSMISAGMSRIRANAKCLKRCLRRSSKNEQPNIPKRPKS